MAWQQTVFLTVIFLVVIFLLANFVLKSRKQEEKLKEIEKRPDADEEIRVLLHEFKNAMTLTDSVAEIISEKGFNNKRFRMMLSGLERFNEVVRIAGGRVGGKRVHLKDVVDEALKDLEARPDVEVEFLPVDGEIIASEMLKFALINLFKNAVEAMEGKDNKKLLVQLETRANRMLLVIKDTGCGIPPDLLEQIWQKGFTTKEGGHGIGMGVIKKGIESSDGSLIYCDSTIGEGTKFMFAFRLRGNLDNYDGSE